VADQGLVRQSASTTVVSAQLNGHLHLALLIQVSGVQNIATANKNLFAFHVFIVKQ
jgi:hypothetical protein